MYLAPIWKAFDKLIKTSCMCINSVNGVVKGNGSMTNSDASLNFCNSNSIQCVL